MESNNDMVQANLKMLDEIRILNDHDFLTQYDQFCSKVTRTEYCKNTDVLPYGFYSLDNEHKLLISNYQIGELYDYPVKGYQYKYCFENSHLIMIERYEAEKIKEITLIHHFKSSKILLDYRMSILNNDPRPCGIKVGFYDNSNRITRYIESDISGNKIGHYSEHIYKYDSNFIRFKKHSYHYWLSKITYMKERVFPISLLEVKYKTHQHRKVTATMINDMLSRNMRKIINSWSIEDIFAITIVIRDPFVFEIDYATIQGSVNDDCDQKWDYTYWNQHSESLLRTIDDFKILEDWLSFNKETCTENKQLIYNEKFRRILISIVSQLKGTNILKRSDGISIPIIVTNLDVDKSIFELNMKLNGGTLPSGYINWYKRTFSN